MDDKYYSNISIFEIKSLMNEFTEDERETHNLYKSEEDLKKIEKNINDLQEKITNKLSTLLSDGNYKEFDITKNEIESLLKNIETQFDKLEMICCDLKLLKNQDE